MLKKISIIILIVLFIIYVLFFAFDNKEYLEAFEHKCNKCTRYKRNCSILKKAKEGRVQEYINKNLECNKFKEVKE